LRELLRGGESTHHILLVVTTHTHHVGAHPAVLLVVP
jgi:hypothetical protein